MRRYVFTWAAVGVLIRSVAGAQSRASHPPVIDMHVHSTTTSTADVERLASLNVRYIYLSGLMADLERWRSSNPDRYLPSLVFPCDGGRAPITGRSCYATDTDLPDLAWLRARDRGRSNPRVRRDVSAVSGHVASRSAFDALWALAEEFDLPVGVHIRFGPPGAAYESSPVPFKSPDYRMAANEPMLLEEVLLRHKRLRLFVMHAGWHRLESMIALLYAHPQLYVDVAGLQVERLIPRAEYEHYLRGLVRAGFAGRIMFGSDFPGDLRAGIDSILEAASLTSASRDDRKDERGFAAASRPPLPR